MKFSEAFIKATLYGIVAFTILLFGGAEIWVYSIVEAIVFLALLLFILTHRDPSGLWSRIRKDRIWIPFLLFTALIIFQLTPLPAPLLDTISPATGTLYAEARNYTCIQIEPDNAICPSRPQGTIALNPYGSRLMLLKLLAYGSIFFLIIYVDPYTGTSRSHVPGFIRKIVWLIFALGIFNALISFLEAASGMQVQWLSSLAPPGSYLGTFKSPNNFSEFLEMVVPLSMGLLFVEHYRETRSLSRRYNEKISYLTSLVSKTGLMSFGIVIMICALLLSLCKGGFVTFPITMIITAFFILVSYKLHSKQTFFLFLFVLGFTLIYLLWLGMGPIINELRWLFVDLGPQGRITTYKDAVRIIMDFPLFGVGLNNWRDIILSYNSIIGRETWVPVIAYNDTLQLMAETGICGGVCIGSALFIIYRKALRSFKRETNLLRQGLVIGGLTAMSAALIHAQFDYLFLLPSNAILFTVIAAMTYRLSQEPAALQKFSKPKTKKV